MKKAFPFICAGVGLIISGVIVWKAPEIVTYSLVVCTTIACFLIGNNNNPLK